MALTEKDLQAQEKALEAIKEELSRLNAQYDGIMRDAKFSPEDLKRALAEKQPPELDAAFKQANEAAIRAGKARAAQSETPDAGGSARASRPRAGAVRV